MHTDTETDIELRLIRAQVARLAALDPLAYDRARKRVASELGLRLATLDAAVEAQRKADALAAQEALAALGSVLCKPLPATSTRRARGRARALPTARGGRA